MKSNVFLFCSAVLFLANGCHKSNGENVVPVADGTAAIIGGVEEQNGKVSSGTFKLVLEDAYSNWEFCTSVLVQTNTLLTAAHCGHDTLAHSSRIFKNGKIYSGGIPDYRPTPEATGRIFLFDENFDSETTFKDDIAVFKTNRPLTHNTNHFSLPKSEDLPEELYISGYGGITSDPNPTLYFLLALPLRTIAVKKSTQLLAEISSKTVRGCPENPQGREKVAIDNLNNLISSKNMFCFKVLDNDYKTPFLGDSGGPVYSLDNSGQPTVHGLFSFMLLNSDFKVAVYCYTNVFQKLDWINKNISN